MSPTSMFCPAFHRFNPRLRTGGDRTFRPIDLRNRLFQSTPPHGRRPLFPDENQPQQKFQSTPPHGRRLPPPLPVLRKEKSFNPRLRTGGDLALFASVERPMGRVSIHASAREATIGQRLVRSGPARFNPRLRTGGDDRGLATVASCEQFQSTPPHGRRPLPR